MKYIKDSLPDFGWNWKEIRKHISSFKEPNKALMYLFLLWPKLGRNSVSSIKHTTEALFEMAESGAYYPFFKEYSEGLLDLFRSLTNGRTSEPKVILPECFSDDDIDIATLVTEIANEGDGEIEQRAAEVMRLLHTANEEVKKSFLPPRKGGYTDEEISTEMKRLDGLLTDEAQRISELIEDESFRTRLIERSTENAIVQVRTEYAFLYAHIIRGYDVASYAEARKATWNLPIDHAESQIASARESAAITSGNNKKVKIRWCGTDDQLFTLMYLLQQTGMIRVEQTRIGLSRFTADHFVRKHDDAPIPEKALNKWLESRNFDLSGAVERLANAFLAKITPNTDQ